MRSRRPASTTPPIARGEPPPTGPLSTAQLDLATLEFARAVARGLNDTPRWVPSRFLYDARGSWLFERICQLPEYYLTRTEAAILAAHAAAVAQTTGPVTLIELGSGSSAKTRHLLDAYAGSAETVQYVSVDVSDAALAEAEKRIAAKHPTVHVKGVVGRYEDAFRLFQHHSPCMVLFLGSTVGNLNHAESLGFWQQVADHLTPADFFLLGVDLVKDRRVLEAAYNDAAGVTAEFTKNLWVRMNRELDAGVDVETLEHVARYNAAWQRMEIFTRLEAPQTVHIAPLDLDVELGPGEMVMTEISRKFVIENLTRYLACFGLHLQSVYTDPRKWFAVLLLQKGETP
ncbi:MAG: L-histidine N(alpha)-methyltransferase [Gemmatimonadetes bacterium]|nr:L-histidine N(alpha)-methyltransferase [Gemmatimonadota bacterium]